MKYKIAVRGIIIDAIDLVCPTCVCPQIVSFCPCMFGDCLSLPCKEITLTDPVGMHVSYTLYIQSYSEPNQIRQQQREMSLR